MANESGSSIEGNMASKNDDDTKAIKTLKNRHITETNTAMNSKNMENTNNDTAVKTKPIDFNKTMVKNTSTVAVDIGTENMDDETEMTFQEKTTAPMSENAGTCPFETEDNNQTVFVDEEHYDRFEVNMKFVACFHYFIWCVCVL